MRSQRDRIIPVVVAGAILLGSALGLALGQATSHQPCPWPPATATTIAVGRR